MKQKIILLIMLLLLGFGYSNAQYGPVVSFSYDDGYPSWYDYDTSVTSAFPIYQEYGFPGVGYINATHWWVIGTGYHAVDKLLEMQAYGWEISSHTYDHSGVTESTVSDMKDWLDSYGFPNSGFGAPNHYWDHGKVNIVKNYHPYYAATYTNDGGISQPFDLYYLERYSLTNDISIETIRAKLDDAVANNKWIIFYGHVIGGTIGDGSSWNQAEELLRLTFDAVVERQIPVKTVREVINDYFPPGCVIECSEDTQQDPVLSYFEEGGVGSFSTSVWNEYWHNTNWTGPRIKGSPVVYCHTSNDTLPVMKFYRNVPNGEYEVRASIFEYDPGRTYRVYYSFDDSNPSQYYVDINKNSDVSLGTVTVTNGQFTLYTQKADAVSGGDGYVGWAFIKLFAQVSANVKVYLQGSYTGGTMSTLLNSSGMIPFPQPYKVAPWNYTGSERVYTMPANIVDWVLVELRTGTAANTTVGRRAAFLKSDGSIVDLDGSSQVKFNRIIQGNYYIVIRHRNHLPIMSANPVSLNSTNSLLYDFSNTQTQAYGTEPMKDLGGGYYGMFAGDANANGQVQNNDIQNFWILQNGQAGYKESDFNLNGQVQNNDQQNYWVPNNGKGTQVPN